MMHDNQERDQQPGPAEGRIPDDLLTPEEAAQKFPSQTKPGKRLNRRMIYRLISRGKLPAWEFGRKKLIRESDLARLLRPVEIGEPFRPKRTVSAEQALRDQERARKLLAGKRRA